MSPRGLTGTDRVATAVASSGNAKLGDAATTHAAQVSCPTTCVFFDHGDGGGGCYAETGQQGKFVTAPLNVAAARRGATDLDVAREEAEAIDELDVVAGRPMRLHTVGDCRTNLAAAVVSAAARRYVERGGGPVWTYTHAWRVVDRSSWGDVKVLASCETVDDVRAARERGYQTSVVVDSFISDKRYAFGTWPNVVDVIPCPSMTKGTTCSECRLCMSDRIGGHYRATIAFEVHGHAPTQRAARAALADPDDPNRRRPSVDVIAEIRDAYDAEYGREPTTAEVAAVMPDLNRSSIAEWLRYLRGDIIHPAERRRRARERSKTHGASRASRQVNP